MKRARVLPLAVVLLAAVVPVGAEEPAPGGGAAPAPLTVEGAADRALAAVDAGERAVLAGLAESRNPDGWVIADALLARGRTDAALALARASKHVALAALPGRLEEWIAAPPGAEDRRLLAIVVKADEQGDSAGALAALEEWRPAAVTVTALRIRFVRAFALLGAEEWDAAIAEFAGVAQAAEDLGWLRFAWRCWTNAASEQLDMEDPAPAREFARRAGLLARRLGEAADASENLAQEGTAVARAGDPAAGIPILESARDDQVARGDDGNLAGTLLDLGNAHWELGELRPALECHAGAAAASRRAGDLRGAARCLVNLGAGHIALEDVAAALRCHEEALALFREVGDRDGIATALGHLSSHHEHLGNAGEERALLEEALRFLSPEEDPAERLHALARLVALADRAGDAAAARRWREAGLAILESWPGDAGTAADWSGASRVLADLGLPAESRRALDRASALAEAEADPDVTAALLTRRANALLKGGEGAEALRLLEQVAGIRAGSPARHEESVALLNLGLQRLRAGDARRALVEVRRARALAESVDQPWLLSTARQRECAALLAVGEPAEALALARVAWGALDGLGAGLFEEEASRVRERFAGVFDVAVQAAAAAGDAGATWEFMESGRGTLLRENLAAGGALREAVLPAALRNADDEARRAEATAALRLRRVEQSGDGDTEAIAAARTALDEARRVRERLVVRVRKEARAASEILDPRPAPLAEVAARLSGETALVLYAIPGDRLLRGDGTALVVRPSGSVVVRLGDGAAIEDACAALRIEGEEAEVRAAADRLRALVVDPLRLPAEVTRVLVSPEGPLAFVPPALLFGEREVACVPSATVLALMQATVGPAGEGVLAMGGPEYGGRGAPPGAAALRSAGLVPLPGSIEEARSVGTTVLVGKDATEGRLERELASRPRWRALHLACHAAVDTRFPLHSAVSLTPDSERDGVLSVLDVFRLRVPADLVVLSACETARGDTVRGEGVTGLVRAFMFAGAPRVVASLWRVEDQATRALMVRFHALWKEGRPAAAALRDAQRAVAADPRWGHPRYWAAWVLWGLPE